MEADEALAQRSRRGDREAFEELVRRTSRLVFARLYVQTADAHRAEDLAQETFLTAWRSIASLSDPKSFRAWLMAISQRVLLDGVRREGRRKRGGKWFGKDRARDAITQVLEDVPDPSPSPFEAADTSDQRKQVLAALRSLPEEYRLPLMLRYLNGSDYQEIGKELAISNGSLRGLLGRGMAMLREKMKGSG